MKKLSTQEFIDRANIAHNHEYDYSDSVYISMNKPVSIKHKKCGMTFNQHAGNHLKGHGCKFCANQYMNTEIFIEKSRKIHGHNRYSYDSTIYKSAKEKLDIFCNTCKKIFVQTASDHIQGYGCNHCGGTKRKTFEEFREKAILIHGDRFSYSPDNFKSLREKMEIKCNSCNCLFKQTPKKHLAGDGCPECRIDAMGWGRSKFLKFCLKNNGKATLYLIHCFNENESFYKIGITCNDMKTRYNGKRLMPYNYSIIMANTMNAGDAWDLEKKIIRTNKALKYSPGIYFGGSITECFSDIPDNIKSYIQGGVK